MDNERPVFHPPPFYWSGMWFLLGLLSIGAVNLHLSPVLAEALTWVLTPLALFLGWRLYGHLADEKEQEAQEEAKAQEAADREWAERVGLTGRSTHNSIYGPVNGTVVQGGDVHTARATAEATPPCRCGSSVAATRDQQ